MARSARVKELFGVYYIHQVSSGERPLFIDDEDRAHFLEILKRTQLKYDFKLYAYCLLSTNEYHLVLEINGCDISSIMKSINIGYAMYVKSPYPLFKDRFKSQLLHSVDEMEGKFQLIHKNGVEGSVYNSYCHYNSNTPIQLDWIAPIEASIVGDVNKLCDDSKSINADCKDCIQTIKEAKKHLDKLAYEAGVTTNQLLSDKQCRNQLIKDFRRYSTLSLKELGILFGGLTESSICKILNR